MLGRADPESECPWESPRHTASFPHLCPRPSLPSQYGMECTCSPESSPRCYQCGKERGFNGHVDVCIEYSVYLAVQEGNIEVGKEIVRALEGF